MSTESEQVRCCGSNGARTNAAGMGCGTIIVLALIFWFISDNVVDDLSAEIDALQEEVASMRAEQAETKRLVETLVLQAGVPAEPEPGTVP